MSFPHTGDAAVRFADLPVPPMLGRQAIAEGYAANPPDDTITVLDRRVDGDHVVVRFVWDANPDQPGGAFRLRIRDGLVAENRIELTR